MISLLLTLRVRDAGASTAEDYVGLTDLDVRTALTHQMESNYREWKKLDAMDGAEAAMYARVQGHRSYFILSESLACLYYIWRFCMRVVWESAW